MGRKAGDSTSSLVVQHYCELRKNKQTDACPSQRECRVINYNVAAAVTVQILAKVLGL